MNNELYEKHFDNIVKINKSDSYTKEIDIAQESANITREIAIKYANWIADNSYGRTSMGIWRSNDKGYTTEELFDKYINDIK